MSAARRATETTTAETEAAEKFLTDLVARGEVVDDEDAAGDRQNDAPAGEARGKPGLPSGVTHEIVHRDKDGHPVVRRRRYSAF